MHSFISALGRQRQACLCEFEASLVYTVNSGLGRAAKQDCLNNNNNKHSYYNYNNFKK